jgi:receptor expression-enhancing protein 5/6
MTSLEKTLNFLREENFKYPTLKKYGDLIEEKTKINVEYYVVGLGIILALMLFANFGGLFISNVIGFAYPTYATIRALESKSREDDTEWLMYWVVFSMIFILENFDWLVNWVPFFYPLKVTFLLWCMLPKYKGAEWVYVNIIKPNFLKHINSIDAALNSVDPKEAVNENKDK